MATRVKSRRRRLAADVRWEQLLDALESVVAEHGHGGATVPRVVARAGLAQGTFYRHFHDIEDALAALARRVLAPIVQAAFALDVSRARTAADVEQALLSFYRPLAAQIQAHSAAVREGLLLAQAGRGRAGRELASFLAILHERVRALVSLHEGHGPFEQGGDPDVVAAAVVGMVIGAVRHAAEQGRAFDAEAWATQMARLETRALVRPQVRGRAAAKRR